MVAVTGAKNMNSVLAEKTAFGIVSQAFLAYNEQLPEEKKLEPSLGCKLVGSPKLDSLDVVNLLVMVEQQVEQDLGISVSLFEEQGIERFDSVAPLVKFLAQKISTKLNR
jgi:hypothetical protein